MEIAASALPIVLMNPSGPSSIDAPAQPALNDPSDRFYESQGLRLHYADWGNEPAPALILIHGGRDHCRSWDAVAIALRAHFHVMAPDLRGHGDSDWAKGSSYSLSDYVYDLTRLLRAASVHQAAIAGHSMGGMIALMYAGAYPDQVSRLAVLDGVTVVPGSLRKPIHKRITEWVSQLDKIAERKNHVFDSVAAAAERISAHNVRLTSAQALHLASHGVRQNTDGSYSWKFDQYQSVRAPYRLSPNEHAVLWSRISCPTLLLRGDESFLPDPEAAGVLTHFKQAHLATIAWAGHWLHHDKLDEVLGALLPFLAG
jgi:pimeloyl-ACP methyl ester carboxylesterase